MPEFQGFNASSPMMGAKPMPTFNPVTGNAGAPAKPYTPKPQVVFEDKLEPTPEEVEIQEEIEMQKKMDLIRKASKTKFATGDVERDIYLYKRWNSFITEMMGE